MDNVIVFPIGDWSDDGHGRYENFYAKSNYTIDQIFDAYYNTRNILNYKLCPENICSEYNDFTVADDVRQELEEKYNCNILSVPELSVYDMFKYLLWYIKYSDDKIEFEIIEETKLPIFRSWNDPQNRGLTLIGYGLFGE